MESKLSQTFASKKKQADEQYKQAQSALKTSLFKWNKDHLGASLYFETAAKLYKEINDNTLAKESYLKYAESSEKIDQVSCAAEGYTQAAFLESDFKKSEDLLKKAQELYMIDGKAERGIQSLSKFAKSMMDQYENSDN